MAGIAGQRQYTDEEKKLVFEQICELYKSQSITIESACEACGISVRTFRLWKVQNAEFADLYLQAHDIGRQIHWEQIIQPLADRAIVRLLTGEQKTERTTKKQLREYEHDDGTKTTEMEVVETTEKISKFLPHAGVAMFAAKGLEAGRFIDKTETKVQVSTDDWFLNLPLETRLQMIELKNNAEKEAKNAVEQPGGNTE